jgi:hypothetical protein
MKSYTIQELKTEVEKHLPGFEFRKIANPRGPISNGLQSSQVGHWPITNPNEPDGKGEIYKIYYRNVYFGVLELATIHYEYKVSILVLYPYLLEKCDYMKYKPVNNHDVENEQPYTAGTAVLSQQVKYTMNRSCAHLHNIVWAYDLEEEESMDGFKKLRTFAETYYDEYAEECKRLDPAYRNYVRVQLLPEITEAFDDVPRTSDLKVIMFDDDESQGIPVELDYSTDKMDVQIRMNAARTNITNHNILYVFIPLDKIRPEVRERTIDFEIKPEYEMTSREKILMNTIRTINGWYENSTVSIGYDISGENLDEVFYKTKMILNILETEIV